MLDYHALCYNDTKKSLLSYTGLIDSFIVEGENQYENMPRKIYGSMVRLALFWWR